MAPEVTRRDQPVTDPSPGARRTQDDDARRWWILLGLLVGVAVLAVVFVLTPSPDLPHTSALGTIFDDRLLLAGVRLLLYAAVAYLLASIAVRAARGQWARSAGPLDTDAPAAKVLEDQAELQTQLAEAHRTIDELSGWLRDSAEETEEILGTLEPPSRPPSETDRSAHDDR